MHVTSMLSNPDGWQRQVQRAKVGIDCFCHNIESKPNLWQPPKNVHNRLERSYFQ